MHEPDIEDLVDLAVVGGDVEDHLGVISDTGDVDRHQVLADLQNRFLGVYICTVTEDCTHLLPLDRPGAGGRHVKHLGP